MDPEKVLVTVKAWLTPLLIIGFATFLYDDITELKRDVKTLLSQSSADAVRIEYLEMEIETLKTKVYTSNNKPSDNDKKIPHPVEFVAVLPSKDDSTTTRTIYLTSL